MSQQHRTRCSSPTNLQHSQVAVATRYDLLARMPLLPKQHGLSHRCTQALQQCRRRRTARASVLHSTQPTPVARQPAVLFFASPQSAERKFEKKSPFRGVVSGASKGSFGLRGRTRSGVALGAGWGWHSERENSEGAAGHRAASRQRWLRCTPELARPSRSAWIGSAHSALGARQKP